MLPIDRNSSEPFYRQLYHQISQGIESGYYTEGNKLPSIRECARELEVSNTTVEQAYRALTEEGYVEPKRGSGYVICASTTNPPDCLSRFSEEYLKDRNNLEQATEPRVDKASIEYDFAYDSVDSSIFPLSIWASTCREVFFSDEANLACLYNGRQGLFELRNQIARYINGEFGVNCLADQVLIMATTSDVVAELMQLFNPTETVIAMENPGYDEVSKRLATAGYTMKDLPIYPYPSWSNTREILNGVNVVFSTPNSQFPTNTPMPIEYRKELIAWARETDAYLIDDEYGWDLPTAADRLPSLATLDDSGHVILLGTFSNSFTPAVCLSYAVLPPKLMLKWIETRAGGHPQVPWQTQAAMAAFMNDGHWSAHIRKLRTLSRKKHETVLESITKHFKDSVDIIDSSSSYYVLIQTRDGRSETQLIDAASQSGIRVYPTSQYWQNGAPEGWNYVLIGYAGIDLNAIDPGIERLAHSWLV